MAGKGARIAHHYRFALNKIFEAFPSSELVIIVEEDILTTPDFIQ